MRCWDRVQEAAGGGEGTSVEGALAGYVAQYGAERGEAADAVVDAAYQTEIDADRKSVV